MSVGDIIHVHGYGNVRITKVISPTKIKGVTLDILTYGEQEIDLSGVIVKPQ